ncbi:EAL domain-containing protein, partial [Ectothiorhodospiraceae bacterium WFHF3C12]|nr:EAL domain-containing protein [Ectothiorhodospiraceae bacterium WFHF3C12]
QNPEIALSIVERLRALGAQIAVDDFGTGYSSLSQLTHFPVNCIKIDRSFVTAAHDVPEKVAVLDAIKRLADALGTKTLAEGVETVDELILLNRLGFDQVQGFLFGKPLSPPEFEARYVGKRVIQEFEPIRKQLQASGYRQMG